MSEEEEKREEIREAYASLTERERREGASVCVIPSASEAEDDALLEGIGVPVYIVDREIRDGTRYIHLDVRTP